MALKGQVMKIFFYSVVAAVFIAFLFILGTGIWKTWGVQLSAWFNNFGDVVSQSYT